MEKPSTSHADARDEGSRARPTQRATIRGVRFTCEQTGASWTWRARHDDVEICFAGKGPATTVERLSCLPDSVASAWLKQCHSATVIEAEPGHCGEGDALVTSRRQLALTVVTADCVPVLLADGERLAAVHAGWRGLAGAILAATLDRFEDASGVTAWIGPAIGPCCYEVGDEVAEQVVAASAGRRSLLSAGPRDRPHLDLVGAARSQLEERGVRATHAAGVCTRCDSQRLWSYRRDGTTSGRNLAAIWRT